MRSRIFKLLGKAIGLSALAGASYSYTMQQIAYSKNLFLTQQEQDEKLKNALEAQVIVVGGGLVGLACSQYLLKSGQNVILLEKEASPLRKSVDVTSFSDCSPTINWRNIKRKLMMMLTPVPAVEQQQSNLVELASEKSVFHWMLNATVQLLKLDEEAQERKLRWISEQSQQEFGRLMKEYPELQQMTKKGGKLMLFKSEEEKKQVQEQLSRLNIPFEEYPTLADILKMKQFADTAMNDKILENYTSAVLLTEEFQLDNHLFGQKLLEKLQTQYKNQFQVMTSERVNKFILDRDSKQVLGLRTITGKYLKSQSILLCSASKDLAYKLNKSLPLMPLKNYMIRMKTSSNNLKNLSALLAHNITISQNPVTKEFSAQGMAHRSNNHDMNDEFTDYLRDYAKSLLGVPNELHYETVIKHYDQSPDDLPIVSRLGNYNNIYVACGSGVRAASQSLAIGKLATELLRDGVENDYDLNRFI